jgi:octanoyl-[GcvH]:protein N-octanoyltransferase
LATDLAAGGVAGRPGASDSAAAWQRNLAGPLAWVRQDASLGAAEDLDYGLRMLQAAKEGRLETTVRVYRPEPTVAFGQRDTHLPGFAEAAERCRDLGFEPLVRKAGGRAAAYHPGCLVIDHVQPEQDAIVASRHRFAFFGELLAAALRDAGIDARMGEIPREYCPGEFSVHGVSPDDGGARVKLVGTAQRVVSGAWLFSSVVVVEDSGPLREVLTQTYDALGLEWDPPTAGAADDLVPGIRTEAVERTLLARYRDYWEPEESGFDLLLERTGGSGG